jgi:hypothetical protein
MRSIIGEEPGIVHTGIRRLGGVESPGYSCPGSHESLFEAMRPPQGGCLDSAVAKRAEGKFIEKGGVTTLVPRPKRLYLGASREQKIDFVGTKSGGVVSAGLLPQQPKNAPLTR